MTWPLKFSNSQTNVIRLYKIIKLQLQQNLNLKTYNARKLSFLISCSHSTNNARTHSKNKNIRKSFQWKHQQNYSFNSKQKHPKSYQLKHQQNYSFNLPYAKPVSFEYHCNCKHLSQCIVFKHLRNYGKNKNVNFPKKILLIISVYIINYEGFVKKRK